MTRHPLMAQIPDELLWVHGRGSLERATRALKLRQWLEARGYRPTFAALEQERQRRRTTDANHEGATR